MYQIENYLPESLTESKIPQSKADCKELYQFKNWQAIAWIKWFYYLGILVITLISIAMLIADYFMGSPALLVLGLIFLLVFWIVLIIFLRVSVEVTVAVLTLPHALSLFKEKRRLTAARQASRQLSRIARGVNDNDNDNDNGGLVVSGMNDNNNDLVDSDNDNNQVYSDAQAFIQTQANNISQNNLSSEDENDVNIHLGANGNGNGNGNAGEEEPHDDKPQAAYSQQNVIVIPPAQHATQIEMGQIN